MNIRERRERLGITQSQLAILADIKQPVLSDIENGKTLNPRVDTISKIAKALGVTVEELLSADDTKTAESA